MGDLGALERGENAIKMGTSHLMVNTRGFCHPQIPQKGKITNDTRGQEKGVQVVSNALNAKIYYETGGPTAKRPRACEASGEKI